MGVVMITSEAEPFIISLESQTAYSLTLLWEIGYVLWMIPELESSGRSDVLLTYKMMSILTQKLIKKWENIPVVSPSN